MPLPKPNEDESQDDFVSRFMGDEQAKKDFPDNDQRLAVAFSKWREKNEGIKMKSFKEFITEDNKEEMQDLVDNLLEEIPNKVGINKRKVDEKKIRKLLKDLKIKSAFGFGEFFKFRLPIEKFSRIYRDHFIFGTKLKDAVKLNLKE